MLKGVAGSGPSVCLRGESWSRPSLRTQGSVGSRDPLGFVASYGCHWSYSTSALLQERRRRTLVEYDQWHPATLRFRQGLRMTQPKPSVTGLIWQILRVLALQEIQAIRRRNLKFQLLPEEIVPPLGLVNYG